MSGTTFTLPPQIVDMLAKGLREMGAEAPFFSLLYGFSADVAAVKMQTDSGDALTFLRGPDMERT